MGIIKFYKVPGLKSGRFKSKLNSIVGISDSINGLETELCYYVETKEPLNEEESRLLKWILIPPFEQENLKSCSAFDEKSGKNLIIEIGPR